MSRGLFRWAKLDSVDIVLLIELLLLLGVANGAPVAAKKVLGGRFAGPADFDARFVDGKPLLGPSKTWRGLICSTVVTGLLAMLLGFGFVTGAGFAAASMAGDLVSSFIKRRLGLPSSSMALGLDQIPEALFPLLAFYSALELSAAGVLLVVTAFLVAELLLSRILYALNLRDRPY